MDFSGPLRRRTLWLLGVLPIAGAGASGYHWAFGKPKPSYATAIVEHGSAACRASSRVWPAVGLRPRWRVIFTVGPIILAFCCAFLTGIVFGYLPARKAAQLDPIEALARD